MSENKQRQGGRSAPPHLFQPLTVRGVTFPNRIAVSPMCQYSALDGVPNDWHLVHLGSRAVGGAGIVFSEATAVEARGRISAHCLGLWNDAQQEMFARMAAFISAQGAVPAIQLAHAGRKASTVPPFAGGGQLPAGEGGWQPLAASPLPFNPADPPPLEMDSAMLAEVVAAFGQSARRAREAGIRLVEVHAAHGYLVHSFLSPLSNQRQDAYGGSLENRARLLMEVLDAVRAEWPGELPLFVRLSCTDWVEGGWDLEQSVAYAHELKKLGCDFIHVSSGGLSTQQQIKAGPDFQVPFAERIKQETGLPTIAVGLITEPEQAEAIIAEGRADMVALGRGMLYNPRWPWHAAAKLGAQVDGPPQYWRGPPGGPALFSNVKTR